jgi:hypothetical protein
MSSLNTGAPWWKWLRRTSQPLISLTVSDVCDWCLEQAEAGRILGRNRRPIKASTLQIDQSRIETHIKPLLGLRLVGGLTRQAGIASAADVIPARFSFLAWHDGGHAYS